MTQHQLHPAKLVYFPNLTSTNHRITSAANVNYNCIAWAAGDSTKWWDPAFGYYWPAGLRRDPSDLQTFVQLYAQLGYVAGSDETFEQGSEKVAIYIDRGTREFTHAALQLADGRWTSKLGEWEDIEHTTPYDLEGDGTHRYGLAQTYMRRDRATEEEVQG